MSSTSVSKIAYLVDTIFGRSKYLVPFKKCNAEYAHRAPKIDLGLKLIYLILYGSHSHKNCNTLCKSLHDYRFTLPIF